MRWFFWAPKTYAKNYGQENISNFMQKIFDNLNLWAWSGPSLFDILTSSFWIPAQMTNILFENSKRKVF